MVEERLIGFQSQILKSLTEEGTGRTTIIVRRRFEHLANEIRTIFSGQPDVNVIVDRRNCRQLKHAAPEGMARPIHKERRRLKEKLVDVVIAVEPND